MKKGFSWLIVFFAVLAITGTAGGAYYLGTRSNVPKAASTSHTQSSSQFTSSSSSSLKQAKEPLFTGSVKKITKNLGLFKISEVDKENGVPDSIVYYEAGTFVRGEFKDYTRILAIRPSEGPGPSMQFLLATKDYSTYLLDDPGNKTIDYPVDDWDNPFTYLDKSKILKTVSLDTDHPKTIEVEKPFELIRQDSVLLENKKTGQKDKNGYDVYLEAPITEFEKSNIVPSSQAQLTLYTGGTDWGSGEGYSDKEKKDLAIRKTYLSKTTYVHGADSTGLSYSYVLSTKSDVDAYLAKAASVEQGMIAYKKQVALYNEKKLAEYPKSPEYATFPGMRLTNSTTAIPADFYATYDSAFPGACGGSQSTFLVDTIKDSDLEAVSSTSDYPLFVLKDTKHPLYELAYRVKTEQGEESFKGVNDGKSIPTFDAYVADHPLVFFKDAWGRWGVMGEYDLKLMGGCGKPVVYLYPEKETTVHLSFTSLISLNTQIPSYHDGWLVNAKPNGTLTDLQPEYTGCSKINSTQFGSEYAGAACKSNSYPYIYWSGKSVENSYPKADGGWVVAKENLKTFVKTKLTDMGLNEKESEDMISYWVPKMSEKNTPYYRISFLQTKAMNKFIPMKVNPKPDSVLRVFLDYKALSSKPAVDPTPQILQKFNRNGFTLVEWGGLNE